MQKLNRQIRLRQADIGDLKKIHSIEQMSQANPWSLNMFVDSLKAGDQILLLEDMRNERLVGFVVFSIKGGECQILNLAIAPGMRKQGYGRVLLGCVLSAVRHFARKFECGSMPIFLEVRESNFVALHLYQSMGFYEVGRRKNYYQKSKRKTAESAVVLKIIL